VSDLVALLADRVAWAEDGEGLEVVEQGDDGPVPTAMSLSDLIEEQRAKRPWFFAAPAGKGSGSQIRASQAPRGQGGLVTRDTWQARLRQAREGRAGL